MRRGQIKGKLAPELLLRPFLDPSSKLGREHYVRVRREMESTDARVRLAAAHPLVKARDGSSMEVVVATTDPHRDLGEEVNEPVGRMRDLSVVGGVRVGRPSRPDAVDG